jgi:excisionase family DNA binding protein
MRVNTSEAHRQRTDMATALTAKREEIIGLRKRGFTYAEIGRRFGISRERVRQIANPKKPRVGPKRVIPDSEVMLRIGEVGQLLGLHCNTVRRWSDSGILKGYRIGLRGDRRFRLEDVQRLIENDTSAAESGGEMKGRWPMQRTYDRVLIVDTDSSLSRELVPALNEAGFKVARVPGYQEAILSLEVLNPDMIILRHRSDESLELCRQLRAASHLPVILFGEDQSKEIWKKALLEAEAEFYIRKPFSTEELIARIRAILRRYRRPMSRVANRV